MPSLATEAKGAVGSPNNLPGELTTFIGRERELGELRPLVSGSRLVTLTGAGGSGKTRLAVKLAGALLDHYPQGVWLVELAPVLDENLVAQTVASVLGLREASGRHLLQTVCAHMRDARALLVLDSCEYLVDACARLVDAVLRACPRVSVLATSQEALNVPGELTWRVPSLTLPDEDGQLLLESAATSEAVRLFVDRARLVQPRFELTKENGPAVARICRRLDGLPLAIELAAARTKVMPAEEMLRRLEDRFRLLTGGSRTALARQQTLRATVDWSYQHLSEREQTLFRRLSVFAGSFSLEGAEAVGADAPIERDDVLELLSRLVDRSLLVGERGFGGSARYRLLETLRQYGQEQLTDSHDEAARRRHADFFLTLVEEAEPHLTASEQSVWLARLEQDHDNLRAALAWALANHREIALRLAAALGRFWYMRGYLTEGRAWLAAALSANPASTRDRARALGYAGVIAWWQGNYKESRSCAERSLAIARELSDPGATARSLTLLAMVVHAAGDCLAARRYNEEALAIRRDLGDRWAVAQSLNNLALTFYDEGNYDTAHDVLLESLSTFEETGDRRARALTVESMARVAFEQGNYSSAQKLFAECLLAALELGDQLNVADALEGYARLAVVQSQYGRAVTLAGAVRALRDRTGSEQFKGWQQRLARSIDEARRALSPELADAAWAKGREMTEEQAVELALGNRYRRPPGDAEGQGILTPREHEIAKLIVAGLSNRQIAKQLVISERTADAHVEHIRNKLGVHSRAEIAAWATRDALAAARQTTFTVP